MLRTEDLSVSYGNVHALNGVNLEVAAKGVLHGIIGPNFHDPCGAPWMMEETAGVRSSAGRGRSNL